MGNVDFQSGDGEKGYQQVSVDSGAMKSAKANRVIVAVATSAILALSGASATQLANYSGTTYNGSAGACAASYMITSIGDPHVASYFGGQEGESSMATANDNNFSTVYNTAGGETTVSTNVDNSPNGGTGVFNLAAGMVHTGSSGFTLNLAAWGNYAPQQDWEGNIIPGTSVASSGGINASLTDTQGNAVSVPHTFADGTTIFTRDDGGTYVVTQALNGGGMVTTDYGVNFDDGVAHLDVSQTATGAALVSGDAVGLATGNDNPILAMPCSGIDPNNGGGSLPSTAPGDVAANNATPAPQALASSAPNPPATQAAPSAPASAPASAQPAPPPTPQPILPADDTSGNGGEESL